MIETVYSFTTEKTKTIEKLVNDDHVMINHILLPEGQGIPTHPSNSNVCLIIVKGKMSLSLNEQDTHHYTAGQIVSIPYGIAMTIDNTNKEMLEFFIVKAPNPSQYQP